MTKRKTDAADDLAERVEREAIAWIERAPTEHWISMARLWPRWLPALSPTSQRRLLHTVLEEAAKRGDPWPAEFVAHFARQAIPHLPVSDQPRAHIHNRDAFRKAAVYRALTPDVSLRDLAKAVGVGLTTVRQWTHMPEFARFEADARFRMQLERDSGYAQLQDQLRQFGRWLGEQIERGHGR